MRLKVKEKKIYKENFSTTERIIEKFVYVSMNLGYSEIILEQ
jgi:hypothetical protein